MVIQAHGVRHQEVEDTHNKTAILLDGHKRWSPDETIATIEPPAPPKGKGIRTEFMGIAMRGVEQAIGALERVLRYSGDMPEVAEAYYFGQIADQHNALIVLLKGIYNTMGISIPTAPAPPEGANRSPISLDAPVPPKGESGGPGSYSERFGIPGITEGKWYARVINNQWVITSDIGPIVWLAKIGKNERLNRMNEANARFIADCANRTPHSLGSAPPIALSAAEKAIPGYAEDMESCVLQVKGKKGVDNPYAVCRSSLREAHNL